MKFFINIVTRMAYLKEWFALLGVFKQLGVVFIIGFILVFLSSFPIGSIENSYLLFVDPSSLPLMGTNVFNMVLSFSLMLFGLVVTGFIISVLSSSLENTFRDIRKGLLSYGGKDHTLIINYNHKLMDILKELNMLYQDSKHAHDVVILLDNESDIEKLQIEIEELKFTNIHVLVRYGNTLLIERYEEISISSVHSIIILGNECIEDPFVRDNHNLRIVNLLTSYDKFSKYLQLKETQKKPVKAIVEFSEIHCFNTIMQDSSNSFFVPLAPRKILTNILNLSMIDLNFYSTWTEVLSFSGYEIYFASAEKYNLDGMLFSDVLLKHKKGMLIGISRFIDGKYQFLLNEHKLTIKKSDWLIFICEDSNSIEFLDNVPQYTPKLLIDSPKETFECNIAMIGSQQTIENNSLLDMEKSNVLYLDYNQESLFDKRNYDKLLYGDSDTPLKYETIIINLEDELTFRVALYLKTIFSKDDFEKFVFLIENSIIAEHLIKQGLKNTILSHLLVSKYIAQISNQVSLNNLFNILFVKEGPEINFIKADSLPSQLTQLKYELVHNNMIYLGVITHSGIVKFESTDLQDASQIIVFSNGEM